MREYIKPPENPVEYGALHKQEEIDKQNAKIAEMRARSRGVTMNQAVTSPIAQPSNERRPPSRREIFEALVHEKNMTRGIPEDDL